MNRIAVLLAAACSFVLAGCAMPEPRDPQLDLPPISMRPYSGPMPTIRVHPVGERPEIGRIIEVTVTVRSGSHRLILDHGDVVEGEALIFMTIEEPAEDEVVTMALETLRRTFRTDREFERVKVHLRSHRRGEVPPIEYRLGGEVRMN